ncbi:hypothetical protein LJK87_35295 [Paenibacillus sp. P25]|nr:hypothetical protein LJK87_35295 [Paenibacillus sp. P25]
MRAAIVSASEALERSPAAFSSFRRSRCNGRYWTRTDAGGFLQNKDVSPSEAVRDIFRNGRQYAFECATAVIIVLYKAVLETIGDSAFNRLFADLYLHSWNHDTDLQLITEYGRRDTYPGDVLYFQNPDVDPATPEWQGENTVKMPKGLYYGHGIGIKNEDGIIAKLNRHRKKGSTVSAHLLDEATYPNFLYIQQEAEAGYSPAATAGRRGRLSGGSAHGPG